MAERVKVGVAGVGQFGEQHVRVYRELAGAELVGIYDADPARAAQIASQYGCHMFSTLAELAADVQAASVVVPTEAHLQVAEQLLEAGADVLVEKPMAR